MVYVIIAVVLAIIILPIIAILPSQRERQQMRMREAARAAGVTVELTTILDPDPDQEKYITGTGRRLEPKMKVAAYRLQRRRESGWRQRPIVNWCIDRGEPSQDSPALPGGFRWATAPDAAMSTELRTFLEHRVGELPEDVEQVEENTYNLAVYWHEREPGGEQRVLDFLKECAQTPPYIAELPHVDDSSQ